MGAVNGELKRPAGCLCDAFRGHHDKIVKERNARHPLLQWLMMHGGITPKFQPLDVLVNRVTKGYFRDKFEEWSLNAPTDPKTGYPLSSSEEDRSGGGASC